MIFENSRQLGRTVWTSLHGLLSKGHMWIIILVLSCELTCCVDGGVLTITSRLEKQAIAKKCSNTELYSQTSWELHESCCQSLYPGQTCPLACPCRHGSRCVPELKQCQCKSGFTGDRCEQTCRSHSNHTWGENCNNTCHCGHDAECDQFLGVCKCIDKNRCSRRCKKHRYGPGCERICTACRDQGLECDSYTGQCQVSSFTRDTSNSCGCKNGGRCLPTGKCDCYWGFHGSYCHLSCPDHFYGRNCRQSCNCGKNAICTPDVGSCRCKNGMGYSCPDRCPIGAFGPRCEYECDCPDGLLCDQKTGDCYSSREIAKTLKNPDSPANEEPVPPAVVLPLPTTKATEPIERLVPTFILSPTTTTIAALNYDAQTQGLRNPSPVRATTTTRLTTPTTISTTQTFSTMPVAPTTLLTILKQITKEHMPIPSRQIQKVRVIQRDQFLNHPPPEANSERTEAPPPPPTKTTTKTTTTPTTLPQTLPITTSPGNFVAESDFIDQGYIYQMQNGTGPMNIQTGGNPGVITTTFYPNNKLWGVLVMIGMLLIILVVLLAILLVRKTTMVSVTHNGEIRGPKKFLQEDNIYETVSELQRNSALHQALHHPLLLALTSAPPDAPMSPRPMSPPTTPRPSTPSSPCPGTPLLFVPALHSTTTTPASIRRAESTTKVRNCNDTLPKPPAKMASMRVTPQEGVALRAKINAKRPRSKSINGLSGIPGLSDYNDDDYADDAFSPFEPEKPARFSFIEEDLTDGTKKKRPFYFVLEADEQAKKSKTLDSGYSGYSGYDDIEAYIPGTPEDREKTLELAKKGIIYSTVERKKRQKVNQEIAKNDNYECPTDLIPKFDQSSLVRVDSRRRVVKEMFAPIAGESKGTDHTYGKLQGESKGTDHTYGKLPDHTYGKLQHSLSNAHVYGRLVPNKITGSRELLEDNNYDQVVRTESIPRLDTHVMTHAAEVYTDNIYDQLDRKNEDIVVDACGQLQRKDSQRGHIIYDRVQRQESFAHTNQNKPKIRDRDHHYDHVERKDGIFTALPPDITVSMEHVDNVDTVQTQPIQENVYGQLKGAGVVHSDTKQKPTQRKDFGAKILNKFKFGMMRNSAPPRRKNITYADFWLDFSLKKRVEDYLKATNSLERDQEGSANRDIASVSGSPFGSMDIVIEDEENWVTIDKAPDGYESVIEPLKDPVNQEENQQQEDSGSSDHNREVNMHSELQKRYSKIQEHMQTKFLESPCLPRRSSDRKEETTYAELRSVRKQYSLQVKRPLPASPDGQHYDQFNRPDKVIRHVRSVSDTAILSISEVAGYQQLNKTATLGYDHLDRCYGGSRPDLADESSDDGYGHLDHNSVEVDYDSATPQLRNSMSLATEDGWVIVPPKVDISSENRLSLKSTGSRRSHKYSNTSMYEEIWPGQQDKK